MNPVWADNAATTLALPISNSATTCTLDSGTGALFPNPTGGQVFSVTLISASNPNLYEIAYCTARSGDVLTITRGEEGTTALAWNAGDLAQNLVTAGLLNDLVVPSGVTSFNTRTGAVTLTSGDVTGALGYTPADQTALLWKNFQMGAFSDFGTSTSINATASFTPATNGQVLLTANAGCTGVMLSLVLSGSGFTPESGSASNFGQTSVGVYTAVLDVEAGVPVSATVTVTASVSGAIGVAGTFFFMPAA
jgi:hypothetical protein